MSHHTGRSASVHARPQAVATRYDPNRKLWKAAIKWPMYSVAVMPVLLAAGWRLGTAAVMRWDQLLGFLLAAILLLLWENLSNDLFDAETGVDTTGKPHSVVNLTGRPDWVAPSRWHFCSVSACGRLAWRSQAPCSFWCCSVAGSGMPIKAAPATRLSRLGGAVLAGFRALATAAAWWCWGRIPHRFPGQRRPTWFWARCGTTLVLFAPTSTRWMRTPHGKRSPVVRLGTRRAAALIPWFVAFTIALEWTPVLLGFWPTTAILSGLGLPPAMALIRLLQRHHDQPERIVGSKFLALRFQAWNGLGLSLGLALGVLWPS